ncbi:MAG: GNAT family N-acetyltransferase [bacterium]
MEKRLVEAAEEVADPPAGFHFRCLRDGEEKKLAQLQNSSFRECWGFNPNTVDDVKLWLLSNDGSPGDIILAFFGEKPVGYCWTIIDIKKGIGRIHMIGVKRQYRGKNLGKALLTKGLDYLTKKRMNIAVLTVDSDNEVAKNLYIALGFDVKNICLWFEKKLKKH